MKTKAWRMAAAMVTLAAACDALEEAGRSCDHICDEGVARCTGMDRGACQSACENAIGQDADQRQTCIDCVQDVCRDEEGHPQCGGVDSEQRPYPTAGCPFISRCASACRFF